MIQHQIHIIQEYCTLSPITLFKKLYGSVLLWDCYIYTQSVGETGIRWQFFMIGLMTMNDVHLTNEKTI